MWDELGYVMGSKYRMAVVLDLHENRFNTPKMISDNTAIGMTHVSRALKELDSKGIVQCMNPDRLKGRIYTLTEMGESIANEISNH